MRSTCPSNEILNPIRVNIGVIGLSGSSQVKGVSGIGKSSICNRLVRPHQYNKQISTLTTVDFYGDIINGSHWIYWDFVTKTIDSKSYEFHIIEQTILINDQTYVPFGNYSESEYISRAISGKLNGSKRAYISPSQFSQTQQSKESSLITNEVNIDVFLIVYDVSEVNSRDYQAQDRYVTEILNTLYKSKKPLIIATSKTDIISQKIRSRLDSILERRNFKSLPLIETSAKLNINISSILTLIGSVINNSNQKSLPFNPLKQPIMKVDSYEKAVLKHKELIEKQLVGFNNLITNEINKHYDLSWSDLCANHNLSSFLTIIQRSELKCQFEKIKATVIVKINESIIDLYVALFKTLVSEFVDSLLSDNQSDTERIANALLNDPQFINYFTGEELSYEDIMKASHQSTQINYPLPRFFINPIHPCNKLKIIESCINEIKHQKRLSKYSEEFLCKLVENSDLYLDMSFIDVYKRFQNNNVLNEFQTFAESIFSEFLESATKKFKNTFDEKLLELSFMIYSTEPMKTSIQNDSKKIKLASENIINMNIINSIDSKIYFDNNSFDREFYRKNRTNWIVKYIGSILSTNPNQCYIFDFNPDACCEHLTKFLNPIVNYFEFLVVIISGDKQVDDIWRDSMITTFDLNTIISDSTIALPIKFVSSAEIESTSFLENRLFPCQKVVFLFSEDTVAAHNLLDRLLNEEIVNKLQLSVINVAKHSSGSKNEIGNKLIKEFNIEYCNIGWSLCVAQSLQKLINEQANSFLLNSEPIFIWLIVLCLDTYDTNIPLLFLLSIFNNYIVTEKVCLNGLLSISLYYIPPNMLRPHRIIISIVSYHQAIKYLAEYDQSTYPHLLIYFSNLFRLASINTMFAVMQNLFSHVNIKSIMCAVAQTNTHDSIDLIEQKSMVERLASDSNIDCIIIEDGTSDSNQQRLWTYVNCLILGCNIDENKNLCQYNDAFENDENLNVSRLKINEDHCKECVKYREETFKENSFELKSFCSHSNSDFTICDACHLSDKFHKSMEFKCIDFQLSDPLGCYNEDEFQPIKEEFDFTEINEIEDKNTIVHINCKNANHRDKSPEISKSLNIPKKPISSKMRSYSGPVQTNKSFSRKSSGSQGHGHRSQRFNKKSQSLTTSPLTSGIKPMSKCENCKYESEYCIYCDSPQANPSQITSASTGKSKKNILTRLFSSERYNSKTNEEKLGFIRRSFKFSKRNSEKKSKPNPVKSGFDSQFALTMSDLACLPLSHSTSQTFAEIRKKSKSSLQLKNL